MDFFRAVEEYLDWMSANGETMSSLSPASAVSRLSAAPLSPSSRVSGSVMLAGSTSPAAQAAPLEQLAHAIEHLIRPNRFLQVRLTDQVALGERLEGVAGDEQRQQFRPLLT